MSSYTMKQIDGSPSIHRDLRQRQYGIRPIGAAQNHIPNMRAPVLFETTVFFFRDIFHTFLALSPVPIWALEIGVTVELVAETPCMLRLKSSCLHSQCLVELKNQVLHSLSGADNESRKRLSIVWLEEPAYGQCGYGEMVSI